MEGLFQLLMAAIVFSAIYGVIRLFVHRKERLIMVEKGVAMPEIKHDSFSFPSLKFGLLFIGIGVGVFFASILTLTTRISSEVSYFSMVFLFGGLALVIDHLIERKKEKK